MTTTREKPPDLEKFVWDGFTLVERPNVERGTPKPNQHDLGDVPGHEFHGNQYTDGRSVPAEPGTTPIPRGKIRGYHYTDNMDAVEKEGLAVGKARGSTYGEPNAIWFSTEKPKDYKDYVEVFLDPDELSGRGPLFRNDDKDSPESHAKIEEFNKGNHDFMANVKQIPSDRFVTTHRPWHDKYRYIAKNPEVRAAVLAGEHDAMLDDPEYGPAMKLIKAEAGKGKDEKALTYREKLALLLGGPGSGNFGHAGRPGEVGGSSEGESTPPEYDRVAAHSAAQDRLKKLVSGTAIITSPDPHLIRTGEQVAEVLEQMKREGLEMPKSVLIGHVSGKRLEANPGVRADITGFNTRDSKGKILSTEKHLTVEIPEPLPADANLDDVVRATFGAPSEVIPKLAYHDTEYQTYDKFAARTLEDVVVHEMGHVQAGHREPNGFDHRRLLNVGTFGSMDAIRRAAMRVSEYALRNENEFLAEAYLRLHRGEKLAEDSQKLYDALNGPMVFFPHPRTP